MAERLKGVFFMFSGIILAVGLTGQSGIGKPPANASPELGGPFTSK